MKDGCRCKKCGSTNTVVTIEGFVLSVHSETSPKLTHYLNCLDCGEKTSKSSLPNNKQVF